MRTITVLSVRQPWAWLLCEGLKDVENRNWRTNYRGELFIHAGKSFSGDITVRVEPCTRCNSIEIDTQSEFFKDLLEYVEKEFGREAALRIELFGLTYHPITRK